MNFINSCLHLLFIFLVYVMAFWLIDFWFCQFWSSILYVLCVWLLKKHDGSECVLVFCRFRPGGGTASRPPPLPSLIHDLRCSLSSRTPAGGFTLPPVLPAVRSGDPGHVPTLPRTGTEAENGHKTILHRIKTEKFNSNVISFMDINQIKRSWCLSATRTIKNINILRI